VVNLKGYNFPAAAIARVQLYQEGEQSLPFKLAEGTGEDASVSDEAVFDIDSAGYFEVSVKVPKGRGLSGKLHQVEIQSAVPSGLPRLSETSKTVIDKMIETIFLAFMATSLALPISIGLSFLAARNLMRQINLPMGMCWSGLCCCRLAVYWVLWCWGLSASSAWTGVKTCCLALLAWCWSLLRLLCCRAWPAGST